MKPFKSVSGYWSNFAARMRRQMHYDRPLACFDDADTQYRRWLAARIGEDAVSERIEWQRQRMAVPLVATHNHEPEWWETAGYAEHVAP